MASVVKSIIDGVKEKGLGGFFRHPMNEGYLRCLPDGNLLQTKIRNIGARLVGVDKFGNKYYEKTENTQYDTTVDKEMKLYNGGYTIEVEIHDGPYNVIKNWDYTRFVSAIHNGERKCWTAKVRTEEDLTEAIATAAEAEKDSLCFIEVFAHKDDSSKELLEWGSRVAAANSHPPNPQ